MKTSKSSRKSRGKTRSVRDPNLRVVLTTNIHTTVTGSFVLAVPIRYQVLSGFSQLSAFFQFAHPREYQLNVQYVLGTGLMATTTAWSGLATFIPTNWLADQPITSFLPDALAETREVVYVQPSMSTQSPWVRINFAQQGWNSQLLDGNGVAANSKILGYALFYNNLITSAPPWTVAATIKIKMHFYKRNVLSYATTPTGYIPIKFKDKDDDIDDDDVSTGSVGMITTTKSK